MPWNQIFAILYVLYALSVIIFLVMDRRSPQSTFAWLLLMLAVPFLGLLVYVLAGRSWKAFSRENEYVRKDIGPELRALLTPLIPQQDEAIRSLKSSDSPPIYSRFLQLGRRNSYAVVTFNNRVQILQDAVEKYPILFKDLQSAKHFIHLEYFSWATDATMEKFNDLLIQKVREGVEVRLLYDALGSLVLLKKKDRKRLAAAGVEIELFSPILRFHTISYRNHRKIAVVDGKVGYVGGLNMGEEHLKGTGIYNAWRDTHLRLEGEAVNALQAAFIEDWYHATKRKLTEARYFPNDEEVYGNVPVQLISSGPDSRYESIRQMFFYMITSASHHVYIQSPFFVLDTSLTEGLKAAALSGVDVRIMLAPQGCGDNPVPYWAAYTYMLDVYASGVKIYLYQPGYLHAKTVSVDGQVCTIGSANMDQRSFNVDYEINAILYDRTLAQELEMRFRDDLKDCVLFDPAEYRKLPFRMRFRDASARLLSPIL